MRIAGAAGWLGFIIFFCISGFVIPYALWQAGYETSAYFRFMARRIVRLDPPYLVSIVLVIVLGIVAAQVPGYRGAPFAWEWPRWAAHLAYANTIVGYAWLSPVYWTLAIEFQFYLALGLLFPFVVDERPALRTALLAALVALPWLSPSGAWILAWCHYFAAGILAFQFRTGLASARQALCLGAVLSLAIIIANNTWIAAVVVVTSMALAIGPAARVSGTTAMAHIGLLSYSLYLVHVPLGGRVINAAVRWAEPGPWRLAAVPLALAASIGVAFLLYRSVELPCMRWSRRIAIVPLPVRPKVPGVML